MSADKKSGTNKRIRLSLDIAMTIILPMLMAYSLIGEVFHEVIGTLMFVLFIIHHVLNRKWYPSLFKGKSTARRIFQTCIDTLLFVVMLMEPVSGILMSKHLYTFIQVPGIASKVREIHLVVAYWGFVLMCFHAGMHLIPFMNRITARNKSVSVIIHLVWLLMSGYGVCAFIKRSMPEYMFHKQIFAFIDISESKIVFFLEHAAVMLLFMLAGYIVTVLLNRASKLRT